MSIRSDLRSGVCRIPGPLTTWEAMSGASLLKLPAIGHKVLELSKHEALP